jgi:hypothetical protein
MKFCKPFALILSVVTLSATAQSNNTRFKMLRLPPRPIKDVQSLRGLSISGMWEPESKDAGKALGYPLQVQIICSMHHIGDDPQICHVLTVAFSVRPKAVTLANTESVDFEVTQWTDTGLTAKTEGLCQYSILSISFTTGAVLLSDVPHHLESCKEFTEINTYRLTRGEYYVDTSPGNDTGQGDAK